MTAPGQVADHAKDEAANVAGAATDKAAEVKDVAADQVTQVAGTAKEQASGVIDETVSQAKDLTAQVKDQATQQLGAQSERLTGGLRDISTQLSEGDTSGLVGQVLSEAGARLEALTDYLEQGGTDGLLRDVRGYAQRNPGTFLLGAALVGLVTGRVVKGVASKKDTEGTAPKHAAGNLGGTAGGDPLAGVTQEGIGSTAGYLESPYPDTTYTDTTYTDTTYADTAYEPTTGQPTLLGGS